MSRIPRSSLLTLLLGALSLLAAPAAAQATQYDLKQMLPFPSGYLFTFRNTVADRLETYTHAVGPDQDHFTAFHSWNAGCPYIAEPFWWNGDTLSRTQKVDFYVASDGSRRNVLYAASGGSGNGETWANRYMVGNGPSFSSTFLRAVLASFSPGSGCSAGEMTTPLGSATDASYSALYDSSAGQPLYDSSPYTNGAAVPVIALHNLQLFGSNTNDWFLEVWHFTYSAPLARYIPLRTSGIRCAPPAGGGTCVQSVRWDSGLVTVSPSASAGGVHEVAACTETWGWTCDPDDFEQATSVSLYRDGPAGTGVLLTTLTANQDRADVGAANVCGGTRNHGFSWTIPASLKDGSPHAIYAYGSNIGSGAATLLGGSPKTITCPAPSPTPTATPTPAATPTPTVTPTPAPTSTPLLPTPLPTAPPVSGSRAYITDAFGRLVESPEEAFTYDAAANRESSGVNP